MIKVLIADDHPIVLQGLASILAETTDIRLVGRADNGADLLKQAREISWDVCVLDIEMPHRNGIETLKLLKNEFPRRAVLMLSSYSEDLYAVRSIKAGASGYLIKQSIPDQLESAIRHVAKGKKYISPSLAERLAESMSALSDKPAHQKLSDRELDVLVLIASGKRLTAIADLLGITVATVSTYRSRLLQKLGLKNSHELIRYAFENELTEKRIP